MGFVVLNQPPIIPPFLNPNVAAWYDSKKLMGMNNAAVAKWFDCSGNGRHATMANVAWAAGSTLGANGLECDGVDDFGSASDDGLISNLSGFTIIAICMPTGAAANQRLLTKSYNNSASNYSYTFARRATGFIDCCIKTSVGVFGLVDSPGMEFVSGNKYHLAMTYDGLNLRTYKNGELKVTTPVTGGNIIYDQSKSLFLGQSSANSEYFRGNIYRTATIKRVLSGFEILRLYQDSR